MDNLSYNYSRNVSGNLLNNKLGFISDTVPVGNYPQDLDNQGAGNYCYDNIGNLIGDQLQNIQRINWTAYGKMASIAKTGSQGLSFGYDAAGNRITKMATAADGSSTTTQYVPDAQGNVLAVYAFKANSSGSLTEGDWLEQHLYGSSRLGMLQPKVVIPAGQALGNATYNFNMDTTIEMSGNHLYELNNHLGNVLVTVNDILNQGSTYTSSSGSSTFDYATANVMSAQDYYPFGMQMPGRTYLAGGSLNYRYGFNGKEQDPEVEGLGDAYNYGMRMYDPRAGRFYSVDPLTGKYPELTPYQFGSNTPIWAADLDGLEAYIKTVYHSAHTGQPFYSTKQVNQFDILNTVGQTTHLEVHKYPKMINGRTTWQSSWMTTITAPNIEDVSMVFGKKVSVEFRVRTAQIAKDLKMNADYLMSIMAFESAGTFSPSVRNAAGSSGTGLIQFMAFTAANLGTTTENLANMTAVQQLDYVKNYFSNYTGKLNTIEDTYMAVLWPKAVGKDNDYVLWNKYDVDENGKKTENLAYKENAGLDTNGDGKITKEEVGAILRDKLQQGEKTRNKVENE